MYQHGMITPVVALVAWSLVMLIWLYVTRIPAMARAKIKPDSNTATRAHLDALPAWARNPAANYNHLMETPTIFYALCFALQLLDRANDINMTLAWIYVGIRIAHSLVQATVNFIPLRFLLFVLSVVPLVMMTVHAAMASGLIAWDFHH